MKKSTLIIVVSAFCVIILAIAWDIVTEITEKGILRSAGKAFLFILMPVFMMTKALRDEHKANRQPTSGGDSSPRADAGLGSPQK